MNYTAYQLQDAMDAQNIDPELSQQIAWALGDQRLNEQQAQDLYKRIGIQGARLPEGQEGRQGSGLLTNLAEGTGMALGELALKSHPLIGSMIGSSLGNYAGMKWLGGDKYYDRATGPQILADMAGSTLGGIAGKAVGSGVGRALGAGAAAGAGRLAGGFLGTALGPIGTVAGSALGGWLLPKLLPDGSKSVAEDDGKSGGGWGTLGAVAAVPLGYKAARKFAPSFMDPFANKVKTGAKWLGGKPGEAAYEAYKRAKPEQDPDAGWWKRTGYALKRPLDETEALTEGGTTLVEEILNKINRRQKNATAV